MKTGSVFSLEVIDSEPIRPIAPHLLPWLIKDRREAVEGAYVKDSTGKTVHDGAGLDKARRALKQAEAALDSKIDDPKVIEFVQEQLAIAHSKVEFYTGKVYLLDKVIAATQALSP